MSLDLKNFVTKLHTSTARDYLARMMDEKVHCMSIASGYEDEYWDGDRRYGYGGYRYIEGRWAGVASDLIREYGLTEQSNILDVGCGKGFLLWEIKKILPGIGITGFDISRYAINNSKSEIRENIQLGDARQTPYAYKDQEFDLVISLAVLHNFRIDEIKNVVTEISRVSKYQYIMVESYRSQPELFNLQCWALTAQTFLNNIEWAWLLKEFNYHGDYELIYFE